MIVSKDIPPLVTTAELLSSSELGGDNYFLLGGWHRLDGKKVLTFKANQLLCACNDKVRDLVLEARGYRLPTVKEIYAGELWPTEWVLPGGGTFLWLSQEGSENGPLFMPLLKRNGPVVGAGTYTQASGMISDDPFCTVWRETNEELCVMLRQGDMLKRILFVPPVSDIADTKGFIDAIIPSLQEQEKEIRKRLPPALNTRPIEFLQIQPTIFHSELSPVSEKIALQMPYDIPRAWGGQVLDDTNKHTLNIHQVVKAVLPAGELIHIDPEGFGRETRFATPAELISEALPKVYALDAYAKAIIG